MAGFTAEDMLRPLPILQTDGQLPTGGALEALRRAKEATGYKGRVLPSKALHGSPEPILAVGVEPGWLTKFALVPDYRDVNRLTAALKAILIDNEDPRLRDEVYLLSKWFKGEVKLVGVEAYDG